MVIVVVVIMIVVKIDGIGGKVSDLVGGGNRDNDE